MPRRCRRGREVRRFRGDWRFRGGRPEEPGDGPSVMPEGRGTGRRRAIPGTVACYSLNAEESMGVAATANRVCGNSQSSLKSPCKV